jgi:hypothetical protein
MVVSLYGKSSSIFSFGLLNPSKVIRSLTVEMAVALLWKIS